METKEKVIIFILFILMIVGFSLFGYYYSKKSDCPAERVCPPTPNPFIASLDFLVINNDKTTTVAGQGSLTSDGMEIKWSDGTVYVRVVPPGDDKTLLDTGVTVGSGASAYNWVNISTGWPVLMQKSGDIENKTVYAVSQNGGQYVIAVKPL